MRGFGALLGRAGRVWKLAGKGPLGQRSFVGERRGNRGIDERHGHALPGQLGVDTFAAMTPLCAALGGTLREISCGVSIGIQDSVEQLLEKMDE